MCANVVLFYTSFIVYVCQHCGISIDMFHILYMYYFNIYTPCLLIYVYTRNAVLFNRISRIPSDFEIVAGVTNYEDEYEDRQTLEVERIEPVSLKWFIIELVNLKWFIQ